MAVTSSVSSVQYNGNGSTTVFAYTFEVFDDDDLVVNLVNSTTGAATLQVRGTHYTVSGVGLDAGGNVTFITAPASGNVVDIRTDMDLTQPTVFRNQGAFLPASHEQAMDRIVREIIQVNRRADLAVRLPDLYDAAGSVNWDTLLSLANRKGKYFGYFNATTGAPELFTSIGATALTSSLIGTTLDSLKQTAAEIAAGVTPTNYAYPPGDVRRYGAVGDGSTDSTTAIQNALTANAGAFPVVFERGSSYYRVTGRVTAPANTDIVMRDGAELRWTATTSTGTSFLGTATRPGIEITGDNFRLTGFGVLRGPTSAAYVLNEAAIFMKGTSTSVRKTGLYIDGDIEFLNWGAYGILAQFVNRIRVFGTRQHDIGYAGSSFNSCTNGRAYFNEVYSITPGDAGNAYGLSCSHDSTGYSTDPNIATPRLVANPFCIDFDLSFNTVYDIPVWRAIDFHGGYECRANHNTIYNTKWPIGMSASSGGASAYAGENNQVNHNFITSKRRDGSATTVGTLDGRAIVLNGGSTVRHINIECIGNTIDGYGLNSSAGSGSIEATLVRNATVRDNKIRNWQREAIYSTTGDGVMAGNLFDAVANTTNSKCIWIDGGTYAWNVTDNRHEPHGGTVAAEGLRITTGSPRTAVNDNNFAQATTPYVNADGTLTSVHQTFAAEVAQRRTVTYTASMTIDAREGNTFEITANNGTAFTINAPTNAADGQVMLLTIKNTSGGALGAITWNAVFKMAAWTSPGTGNNRSITFVYDGTNWIERHRTAADVPN